MLIRLLRTYLRPYNTAIIIVVMAQLVQAIAALYLPTLNADIIDKGVTQADTGYILRTGAVMLAVSLIHISSAICTVYYGARTAMSMGRDIRAALFHTVGGFSSQEMNRFGAPSLITRTTNDVQQVQMVALLGFTLMITAPLVCLGGVILALRQDVALSALLLFIVPLLILFIGSVIIRMRPLFRSMQENLDQLNRIVREHITGIRVIRAFVRDEHERERYTDANKQFMDVSIGIGRLMALAFPVVMLIVNISSVVVLWFGGHRIDSADMTVGAMTAFLAYLMQILFNIMMATMMFIMVPRAEVCSERIVEVLDTESRLLPPQNPVKTFTHHGHLDIVGVDFQYPGAEEAILRDINLTARPGQTTAIIGSTGSGKTTLINLISRMFDVTQGKVMVNGVDVRSADPSLLSQAVGIVPQKPYLFSGTVASNLRYGRQDATDAELWHALDIAQAREFVERMPEGLNSPISQGGTNISGGQRQRLSIARALVRKPEIYLFDDSFSSLDYATDSALRHTLTTDIADATVIIVAQRVSTIKNADRILVLDKGRIVGEGTHTTLMSSNLTYREIVLSQLTEQEAAA